MIKLTNALIAALVVLAVLSGCAVTTPVGVDAQGESLQDDRWQAWRKVEESRLKNQKPTLSVTTYGADGRTPVSTTVVDLNGVLGRGATPLPSGPVAEAITATGNALTSLATTPTAIVGVTGAALVGALRHSGTTVTTTDGVTTTGPGTGTMDKSIALPPEGE